MLRILLSVSTLVLVAACAADTTISLAGLDTSCVKDQDCWVVQIGDICGCDCGNAAINLSSAAAYDAELNAKSKDCTTKAFCDCLTVTASCKGGQCVMNPPTP